MEFQHIHALAAESAGADPVAHFLLALAVIVVVCNLLAWVFRKLGQPPVVGEIVGGLLLGPTVLAQLWPAGSAWLLTPSVVGTLSVVAQLGLVTFMFLLGSELRFGAAGADRKIVTAVVAGSIGLPFAGGMLLALAGRPMIAGEAGDGFAYLVVFGLAVSITALPVLARILVDARMDTTRVGRVALACAAVGDGAAWMVLTVVLAVSGLAASGSAVVTVGLVGVLVLVTALVVRPALAWLVERAGGGPLLLPMLVAGAVSYAAVTQLIGLHAAVGAFLFGAVIPRDDTIMLKVRQQLHGFAEVVLLPLFFASVGLSTAVTAVGGSLANWLLLIAVVVVATATKFVGAGGAAYLAGMPVRESLQIGALMNCRGVTELIVATICLQYGVVNTLGFTVLVLMALCTTAVTGPLLKLFTSAGREVVLQRR
ncbi:cation:proton antiporter [Lentzea sp. NPDC051213]|uniref:cation:proton antiporter domain-containing protein n=1 Tax=Lentzea sp. NPDC051213 TaxID=3364126 RepID=UPI0037BBE501